MEKSKIKLETEKKILFFDVEGSEINKRDVMFNGKTFDFVLNNQWTLIKLKNKAIKISQLKNVQSKECLFGFTSYNDIKDGLNNIINGKIEVNKEYLKMGLGIFQDLSKTEDKVLHFIYKLKEKNVEKLKNQINHVFGDEVTLQKEDVTNYFYYDGINYDYRQIEEQLDKAIENNGIVEIFSFLLGLYFSGYVVVDKRRGVIFQIPLIKTLFLEKQIIYKAFEFIRKFFSFSESRGNIVTYSSNDGDFEYYFQTFIFNTLGEDKEGKYTNNIDEMFKKIISSATHESLLDFLKTVDGLENYDEFVELTKNHVLKVYEK